MLEASECFVLVFSVGSVGPHPGVPQRALDRRANEGYLRLGLCPLLPSQKIPTMRYPRAPRPGRFHLRLELHVPAVLTRVRIPRDPHHLLQEV